MVWAVLVYVLPTCLKTLTPWCLMGSLEKGPRTAKTDTKLVNKSPVSGPRMWPVSQRNLLCILEMWRLSGCVRRLYF